MLNIQAIEVNVPLERPRQEKYGAYSSAHKSSHSLLWNIEKRQFIPTPLFSGNEMACRFYRWLEIKLGYDEADEALMESDSGAVNWFELYYEFMAIPLTLTITFAEPEFETSKDEDTGDEYHHDITFRKRDEDNDYTPIPPNDSRTFAFEVIPIPHDAKHSKHPVEVKIHLTEKQKDSLPKYAKMGIEETMKGDEHWFEYNILNGSTDWSDSISKRIGTKNDKYKSKVVVSVSAAIVSPEWATKEASKDDLTY